MKKINISIYFTKVFPLAIIILRETSLEMKIIKIHKKVILTPK